MRPVAAEVAWSVCVCVCACVRACVRVCVCVWHNRGSCKTAEPIEMLFGLWTRVGPRNNVLGGLRIPFSVMGNFRGLLPPLKCIRLRKQQTPQQQHGAADLSAGGSASRQKRGFITDSRRRSA